MKVKLVLLLLMLSVAVCSKAQNVTFTKVWEKVYGGLDMDVFGGANCLKLDKDSNIVIAATSISNSSGNKTSSNCVGSSFNADIWLIKLDQNGNKVFDNSYGGADAEGVSDVKLFNDGSIVLAGRSDSHISCIKSQNRFGNDYDNWLIKLDSNGNKLWDKRYGTTNNDYISNFISTPDNGFIIAGAGYGATIPGNIIDTTNGSTDITIIKIDSAGAKQWDKLYGGIGAEFGAIFKTSTSDYIITGVTNSWLPGGDISTTNIGGNGNTGNDGWILKIDSSGTIKWEHRYGCPNGGDDLGTSFEISSGDYVVLGMIVGNCEGGNVTNLMGRGSGDIWLLKLDSATGSIKYDKRIGGNLADIPSQIIQTSDGGYLMVCRSNSDAGFEKSEPRIVPTNPNLYQLCDDFWIVKTDSMFNVQWDKTIGGAGWESSPCLLLLNDSTFILAGTSDSPISGDKTIAKFDTLGGINGSGGDIWVTKWTVSAVTGINEIAAPQFSIYPNPVADMLYVSPKKQLPANTLVSIIDMQGRVIKEEKISQKNNSAIELDVSKFSQGVYLVKLNGQVQRFVKL